VTGPLWGKPVWGDRQITSRGKETQTKRNPHTVQCTRPSLSCQPSSSVTC